MLFDCLDSSSTGADLFLAFCLDRRRIRWRRRKLRRFVKLVPSRSTLADAFPYLYRPLLSDAEQPNLVREVWRASLRFCVAEPCVQSVFYPSTLDL